jgi:hypothetical protein
LLIPPMLICGVCVFLLRYAWRDDTRAVG